MNRDAEARLTISSPLEAHKQYTLCYGMVGIDVGFENPTFACLEYDYEVSAVLHFVPDVVVNAVRLRMPSTIQPVMHFKPPSRR